MHNLKKQRGNFKGLIGECMFKIVNKRLVLTQYFNRQKYQNIFGKHLSNEQRQFIYTNWYSLDGIEIKYEKGAKEVILFEIKTKNEYCKELWFKPKVTRNTYHMYIKAQEIGFSVKLAVVIFRKNWNYDIKIQEFDKCNICIDKPKEYDPRGRYIK